VTKQQIAREAAYRALSLMDDQDPSPGRNAIRGLAQAVLALTSDGPDESVDEEVEALRDAIKRFEASVLRLRIDRDALRVKLADAEDTAKWREGEIEQLEGLIDEERAEIKRLRERVGDQHVTIMADARDLRAFRTEAEEAQAMVQLLKGENKRLCERVNKLVESDADLRAENERLRGHSNSSAMPAG